MDLLQEIEELRQQFDQIAEQLMDCAGHVIGAPSTEQKYRDAWQSAEAALTDAGLPLIDSETLSDAIERIKHEREECAAEVHRLRAELAEFERGLIRERTRAGLEAARARGRSGGRKPKLDAKQIRHIKALLRDPNTCVAELARDYGVSRTTIYKHCGVVQPRHD